jgi:hypothetical protein
MRKYLDEYLVSLGFDVDVDSAKKYEKMCDEIDAKNKSVDAYTPPKRDLRNEKDEADAEAQNEKPKKKRHQKNVTPPQPENQDEPNEETTKNTHNPSPIPPKSHKSKEEAPKQHAYPPNSQAKPPQHRESPQQPKPPQHRESPQQPKPPQHPKSSQQPQNRKKQKSAPKSEKESTESSKKKEQSAKKNFTQPISELKKSIQELERSWENFKVGKILSSVITGASGAKSFSQYMGSVGQSFKAADKQAGSFGKTVGSIFGGQSAVDAASGGISDAAGSIGDVAGSLGGAGEALGTAGAGAAAAGIGIAAAVVATGKGIWDMSNGLADANTNIETMSRRLWISESAAYQLNSTLGAMGKTTADLNEIAINPTLNKRYKELQKQAKGQDNTKAQKGAEAWAGVQTEWDKFKENMSHIGNSVKGDFASAVAPGLEKVLGALNGTAGGVDKMISGSKKSPSTAYAPQSAYYNSNYAEGAKVEIKPTINVKADSNNAVDIGKAAANSTSQVINDSTLVRNVRGLNR